MVKVILILALSTIRLSCSTILVKKENLALKEKQIILSFDDGPNPSSKTTRNLLTILKNTT